MLNPEYESLATNYLHEVRRSLRAYKRLAEGAMAQVSDEEFLRKPDPESNSIAVVVKHIAGNLRSRWTDFLTTDGEKPDRRREQEFEDQTATRGDLMRAWEESWEVLFRELEKLRPEDLERSVTIQGEPYPVMKAINVAANHYSYHIGQIVFLAKHFRGGDWKSLRTPRPGQERYTGKPK